MVELSAQILILSSGSCAVHLKYIRKYIPIKIRFGFSVVFSGVSDSGTDVDF